MPGLLTTSLLCTLSLLYTQNAFAYPFDWINGYNGLPKPACDSHPTVSLSSYGSPHGSPRTDSGITFAFSDPSGKVTDVLCPGSSYVVKVSFSSSRLALLTVNSSSVAFSSSTTSSCPNRVDLGQDSLRNAQTSYAPSFNVPCSAAGTQLNFFVTSAGSNRVWNQASRKVAVAATNSATTTTGGGAADSCAAALAACASSSSSGSAVSPPPSALPSPPPAGGGSSNSSSGDDDDDDDNDNDDGVVVGTPEVNHRPFGDDGGRGGDGDGDEREGSKREGPSDSLAATSGTDITTGTATTNSSSGGCTPSTLGYDCMTTVGKLTLHWSLNTPSAPAGNGCTPSNTTTLKASDVAANGTLHMAVQSRVSGYVALGFNSNTRKMYPADLVLGWASGANTYLNTFHTRGSDLNEGDALASSWAYDTGVSHSAATGTTTICFSRRLKDSRAAASADLLSTLGSASTSSSSSSSSSGSSGTNTAVGGRRRLTQTTSSSSSSPAEAGFIWAVSSQPALIQHSSSNVGGFHLDLRSGSTAAGSAEQKRWIMAHGALMAVAWGLLLPLGTLLPAHRWIFGDAQLFGKAVWFVAHMTCQWTGVAFFVAGFVIAFVKFNEGVGQVEQHEQIGIAIMAAAGAQVVVAYIRPAPGAPRRGLWNLIHHNLGRATVLLAWANVYFGIYLFHVGPYGASYIAWITPIAIVMGLLVVADVTLRIYACSSRRRDFDKTATAMPYGDPIAAAPVASSTGRVSPAPPVAKAAAADGASTDTTTQQITVKAADGYGGGYGAR